MDTPPTYTAFAGHRCIARGSRADVAHAVAAQPAAGPMVLVFDDRDGRQTEIDTPRPPPPARGRGRPKLGVTAREITLLPRHWDWLAAQPGGASVALRKLVDAARRADTADPRAARDAAYRFMTAIAGDLPGYEEALRALFAGDGAALAARIAAWPADIRSHALRLAQGPMP